ncbi:hypothetical protein [Burkholderia glumae]|uniref:hypothetical protein n=1 Tax=Burkholderia glumae TaxID=337 RepID=UPI0020CCCEFC|nr:hypothetical protein [Burkholderia glumae]MCQ0032547.1 hypothetical protein [Burkholderia glumae]MCQ0035815.1 hypothetical protein [Burkholderia glumae]
MKKILAGSLIAAMPILGFGADASTCEVLVRAWAKDMAYVSACNAATGLEDRLRDLQAQCKFIGKKRAEGLIKMEFEAAREANMASHETYCENTKRDFEEVGASLGLE